MRLERLARRKSRRSGKWRWRIASAGWTRRYTLNSGVGVAKQSLVISGMHADLYINCDLVTEVLQQQILVRHVPCPPTGVKLNESWSSRKGSVQWLAENQIVQ
ncbi:hypothetical protein LINPERHAP1_LOCUS24259 [Linum perenne]